MDWKSSIANLKEITGLSLQRFATALDLSMTAVQNYLAGRQPNPKAIVALAMLAERYGAHKLSQEFMAELLSSFPLSHPGVWAGIRLEVDGPVHHHNMAVLWVSNLDDSKSPLHSLTPFLLAFLAQLGAGSKPALDALRSLADSFESSNDDQKSIAGASATMAAAYKHFAKALNLQNQLPSDPEREDTASRKGSSTRRRTRKTES